MMKKELGNFIITSDIDIDYFDSIFNFVLKNENNILNFFRLKKLPQKFNIIIMSYESFKNEEIKRFGKVIDYIRGITDGSNHAVMILNINDQIEYTTHKDATLSDTLSMILHEAVHACHYTVNNDLNQTIWFREGLATNLSGQNYSLIDLSDCNFDLLKNDFNNYGKNNYAFSYTIVYYVLQSYNQEEVYRLIIDSEYLRKRSNEIFSEAKEYVSKEKLSR